VNICLVVIWASIVYIDYRGSVAMTRSEKGCRKGKKILKIVSKVEGTISGKI